MRRKKEKDTKTPADSNALVFLNTPIHDKSEDVLGLQAHVDSLQAAIDSGAQMIAVTSPFGAGKSSVTELLHSQNANQEVINVSMWSHLCQSEAPSATNSTTELHRSFLYQIVSQLNAKAGAYISRRLSKNYGLLKLHTESVGYYVIAFISLVLFILGYVLPYVFHVGIPTIWGEPEIWNGLMLLTSVICFVYVIARAEIVFSSNKSEGSRALDENELVELYHKFVHNYCKNKKKVAKYIFVIEDLDRSDKHDCVVTFLKELRKYYMQNSNSNGGKIAFIVNVKPETSLFANAKEHKAHENESLYAKLFDYVLNIQTINIDDYETVLESILQKNANQIKQIFPNVKTRLIDIDGMQWIIHGKNFGVRDIKDRLNKAFTLFSSLRSRFKNSPIEFEKCAVVAYLTTTYEKEFIKTDDQSFGVLVEAHLQHILDQSFCQATLASDNPDYVADVMALVEVQLIDTNYRMYFYNYPKDSRIYSHDESIVEKAILYKDTAEGFEEIVTRVVASNPKVIYDTLDKLAKLKLPLPEVIINFESLYIATLRYFSAGIYNWMTKLDYSKNAYEKTSSHLLHILKYDAARSTYSRAHASQFCKIWEDHFAENELLHFRHKLCVAFSSEILWYAALFHGVHNLITTTEMDLLSLDNAIRLINLKKDNFDVRYIKYVLNRFEKEISQKEELAGLVIDFLSDAETKLGSSTVSPYLLQFMISTNMIIDSFEESVMGQLQSDTLSHEQKESLFLSYQKLINALDSKSITATTAKNIHTLDRFSGYTESIASILEAGGYLFDAIIVKLHLGLSVDYQEPKIVKVLQDNLSWLKKHIEIFTALRLKIARASNETEITAYSFLFATDCPVLTVNEFNVIKHRYADEVIFSLLPADVVTQEQLPMLKEYFNRGFQQNTLAHNILLYISQMQPAIAKTLFYQLDFAVAIKYSDFAAARKRSVKEAFRQILNLDTTSEKIRFMEATRCMDSAWEEQIYDTVKGNSTYTKNYISAVNSAVRKSITLNTIKCICSLPGYYALNNTITERLYIAKKYSHYVLSKALFNKRFILDDAERIDMLWPTYLEIFSSTNHPVTRGYMDNNLDFLKLTIDRKGYVGLSRERRMIFSKVSQDSDCLLNAVEYGDAFVSDYFSKIAGFCDSTACDTYLEILEQKPALLKSQVLYDHCHDMLHGSIQKSKYTRLRKKHNYM